jgi:hypothetical protein
VAKRDPGCNDALGHGHEGEKTTRQRQWYAQPERYAPVELVDCRDAVS